MTDVTPSAQAPIARGNEKDIETGIIKLKTSWFAQGNMQGIVQQVGQWSTMGHDHNPLSGMVFGDFKRTLDYPIIALPPAFPFRDDVIRVAGHILFVFFRILVLNLLEVETLENTEVPFTQTGIPLDLVPAAIGDTFGGAGSPLQITAIKGLESFFGKTDGQGFGLSAAVHTQFAVEMALVFPQVAPHRLPMSDDP